MGYRKDPEGQHRHGLEHPPTRAAGGADARSRSGDVPLQETRRKGPPATFESSCRRKRVLLSLISVRDCMKSPQAPASRLVMRRIMQAYTNASPLAHSLS